MSNEVKNAPQLRIGLFNEILSEAILIRVDQALCTFYRCTTVLLLCRDATLRWDTVYMILVKKEVDCQFIDFVRPHRGSLTLVIAPEFIWCCGGYASLKFIALC
jgi:hypothetical protein